MPINSPDMMIPMGVLIGMTRSVSQTGRSKCHEKNSRVDATMLIAAEPRLIFLYRFVLKNQHEHPEKYTVTDRLMENPEMIEPIARAMVLRTRKKVAPSSCICLTCVRYCVMVVVTLACQYIVQQGHCCNLLRIVR